MSEISEQNRPEKSDEPRRYRAPWWGLILIVLGVIFLLQTLGVMGQHFNWWALFILIPALASFGGAWSAFQRSGKLNAAVRSGIGGGLVVLTVALMFLFNLDWAIWWPLMLIVPGLSFFLNGFSAFDTGIGPGAGGWAAMSFWIGLSVGLLGVTFLLKNLNDLNPVTFFGWNNWWGFFILIPGIGAVINAIWVFLRSGGAALVSAIGLLIIGLLVGAAGMIAILSLDWQILNILGPLALIIGGLAIVLATLGRRQ